MLTIKRTITIKQEVLDRVDAPDVETLPRFFYTGDGDRAVDPDGAAVPEGYRGYGVHKDGEGRRFLGRLAVNGKSTGNTRRFCEWQEIGEIV